MKLIQLRKLLVHQCEYKQALVENDDHQEKKFKHYMCILYILNQDAFQSNVKTNSIQRKITQKQRKPLKKNGPSKTTHAHML